MSGAILREEGSIRGVHLPKIICLLLRDGSPVSGLDARACDLPLRSTAGTEAGTEDAARDSNPYYVSVGPRVTKTWAHFHPETDPRPILLPS